MGGVTEGTAEKPQKLKEMLKQLHAGTPQGKVEERFSEMAVTGRKVLFACVENSFRSQMAEAYFNKFAPENWKAISAGIKPADKVHPMAVQLMREEGIDISHKKPQLLTRELQEGVELAVIVCSGAECPLIYVKNVRDWSFPDPAKMSIDEARKVRDAIKEKVLELIKELASKYG